MLSWIQGIFPLINERWAEYLIIALLFLIVRVASVKYIWHIQLSLDILIATTGWGTIFQLLIVPKYLDRLRVRMRKSSTKLQDNLERHCMELVNWLLNRNKNILLNTIEIECFVLISGFAYMVNHGVDMKLVIPFTLFIDSTLIQFHLNEVLFNRWIIFTNCPNYFLNCQPKSKWNTRREIPEKSGMVILALEMNGYF